MQPPAFLVAEHPRKGTLWAAVDPTARFLTGSVAERRFGAYLSPFTTEADARAALIAAGAHHVEAEHRPRGKRRG